MFIFKYVWWLSKVTKLTPRAIIKRYSASTNLLKTSIYQSCFDTSQTSAINIFRKINSVIFKHFYVIFIWKHFTCFVVLEICEWDVYSSRNITLSFEITFESCVYYLHFALNWIFVFNISSHLWRGHNQLRIFLVSKII